MFNVKNALALVGIEFNKLNQLLQQYSINPHQVTADFLTKIEHGMLDLVHLDSAKELVTAAQALAALIDQVVPAAAPVVAAVEAAGAAVEALASAPAQAEVAPVALPASV